MAGKSRHRSRGERPPYRLASVSRCDSGKCAPPPQFLLWLIRRLAALCSQQCPLFIATLPGDCNRKAEDSPPAAPSCETAALKRLTLTPGRLLRPTPAGHACSRVAWFAKQPRINPPGPKNSWLRLRRKPRHPPFYNPHAHWTGEEEDYACPAAGDWTPVRYLVNKDSTP